MLSTLPRRIVETSKDERLLLIISQYVDKILLKMKFEGNERVAMYEMIIYCYDECGRPSEIVNYKKITKPLADDESELRQIEHLTGILKDIEKTFCGKRRDKKVLIISQKGKEEIFREEDILYIERKGRETRIYLRESEVLVTSRLEELEEQLADTDFVRCHKSYLVNLDEIRQFRRTEFVMRNGERIPISRNFQESVKTKFMNWAKEKRQKR
ncbi:LytR/AlgR family response regulator transcription factor [[Clostridium] scindens]|nr:LytTR family DNA-binding domain-containing protein [[Clostridium] scindens]